MRRCVDSIHAACGYAIPQRGDVGWPSLLFRKLVCRRQHRRASLLLANFLLVLSRLALKPAHGLPGLAFKFQLLVVFFAVTIFVIILIFVLAYFTFLAVLAFALFLVLFLLFLLFLLVLLLVLLHFILFILFEQRALFSSWLQP